MADYSFGPWPHGLDNVNDDGNRDRGSLSVALNVDVDRAGGVSRRGGYRQLRAATVAGSVHSAWHAKDRAYAVVDGVLGEIDAEFNHVPLYTLEADLPVTYDVVNDDVIAGTTRELLRIRGDVVVKLGVENAGSPLLVPLTYGGLLPGKYAVACAFTRGNEEGGLSKASFVTVGDGGGITVTVPQPLEADVTGVRLYRTDAGGTILYRAMDLPLSIHSFILGSAPAGRQTETQFMQRMPGGHIVRYWRGRTLVADGCNVLFSEAYRLGLYVGRHNVIPTPSRITMMQPMRGGVWLGNAQGVYFYAGEQPDALKPKRTSGLPVKEGSCRIIAAAELGKLDEGLNARGEFFALWLAQNGFVLGTEEGRIIELHGGRITLPPDQLEGIGAAVVHQRRVIATV